MNHTSCLAPECQSAAEARSGRQLLWDFGLWSPGDGEEVVFNPWESWEYSIFRCLQGRSISFRLLRLGRLRVLMSRGF